MINVAETPLPSMSEYNKYLKLIWKNHWVTNDGELVKTLEKKLSKLLGAENLVLVNNATLGLMLTLRALKIKGEVITTPFTFVATTNAIIWQGLKPVFVDIDPETFNIDPVEVEKKITKDTVAIVAVHVYGNPCEVEKLTKIAKKRHLKLIFDAAHAFNVSYKDKSILRYGDASILSFHATKTFHTIEGGAIAVRDNELAKELSLYRNFGIKSEEEILLPGINAKMNEFQAAMGLSNLAGIDEDKRRRKLLYNHYKKNLKNFVMFQKLIASDYNYAYMPIVFKTKSLRDMAYSNLFKNGIKARKYFYPLTSDLSYTKAYLTGSLPNARKISDTILCLPIYRNLKIEEANRVIKIISRM